ncbi:MAG: prolipoprotein diacylglyceryl transferase, phosphatidylglycerol:prolipoprotein diacylglycerol transferase [candidate division WS6 bacterium GW2011_GWC1_33_20]|uniref:Prolipoprotein diacylglyceryl transferase n=2 Tax=Candidatus Dojkabacteria TaxID=74243 RepID=A0A0G0AEV2_9BACT|nr:MAG: prolipoprotein diacylglyceryl transferase, phosphatidylglycerol:prolipoprotein diacylglycerol transferase [candidate division WS6 bacterium GW2011_GWE2_33_157]KKP44183.1 MAG: prolipoprotein diacylglyceryl transferase, phosphatidylglycerol:prolipoprotein diacylglycerol transferase [candidate division WS6 bacterium GW2011_GWC1_33_20]KKP45760.1 MAG: prolipoprotein diacylglyceryl transferase, phosphatidylglycerol:prolipoprotein diacylglycerol transferase [candidate division WS6 bacterium GW20
MSIYGALIGIGIIIGIELIRKYYKQISYTDILIILVSALIGARGLFLLHNIREIQIGIINPIAVWDGGLAFFGGLIGILLSIYIISKKKKLSFLNILDSTLLFLPLIQSIGRIGNFFNHELYGKPTSLPWGVYVPEQYRDQQYISFTHFHPVFFYESILNILNFAILLLLRKKFKKEGYITAIYFINYSLIRLLMNVIRIDKEYILNLETSDIFSGIFLAIGVLILLNTMENNNIKDLIAKFFSRILTISLIILAIVSILLKTTLPFETELIIATLTFVVPILTIVLFKKLGITSDFNVSKRSERPRLFAVMAISFAIALYIAINSSSTLLIVIFSTLNITFFLGFVITLFWKISFHMIWSILATFFIIYSLQTPQSYLLILFIPLIAWSRLQLKRHSLLQVVAGTLLTLTCIFLVLTFIKF